VFKATLCSSTGKIRKKNKEVRKIDCGRGQTGSAADSLDIEI
jgi:hypothetical protein